METWKLKVLNDGGMRGTIRHWLWPASVRRLISEQLYEYITRRRPLSSLDVMMSGILQCFIAQEIRWEKLKALYSVWKLIFEPGKMIRVPWYSVKNDQPSKYIVSRGKNWDGSQKGNAGPNIPALLCWTVPRTHTEIDDRLYLLWHRIIRKFRKDKTTDCWTNMY